LKSATEIELSASTGFVSIAPEQNLAHTKVERTGWVSGVLWDMRGDVAVIDWHFLWTPARDGLLNIVSALATNGFAYAYPGPGCVKGTASWSIDAQISLAQVGLDGQLFTDSSSTRIYEGNFGESDMPSYGGVILNGTRLDSMTTLTYQNQFPTIPQTPIAVTVSVTLYVLVAHGEAAINFLDGDFQLNVPFVYLFMT
jgi:hypothetical protein